MKQLALLILIAFAAVGRAELIPSNRLHDWSVSTRVGVPGGIDQYRVGGASARTSLVNVLTYGADPTGVADSAQAFRDAIAAATDNQVVYLPAGTYRVDSSVATGGKDNFTIRGAGPTLTKINYNAITGRCFSIGQDDGWTYPEGAPGALGAASKGATVIPMSDTSLMEIDVMGQISLLNTPSATPTFAQIPVIHTQIPAARSRRQNVMVLSKTSSSITISEPLAFDLPSNLSPRITINSGLAKFVGVEDLWIEGLGSSTPHDLIGMNQAYASWFYNVKATNTPNYNIGMGNGVRNEIRKCQALMRTGGGTNGAGIIISTSSSILVEDNIIGNQFPLIEVNDGVTGSVFAYNFGYGSSIFGAPGVAMDTNHGPHNSFNLYEGNLFPNFQCDGFHGSASEDTIYRNWFHCITQGTIGSPGAEIKGLAVNMNRFTRRYSIVGNILGTHTGDSFIMPTPPGADLGMPNMGNYDWTGEASPINGDWWASFGTGPGSSGFQELDLDVRSTTWFKGNYNAIDNAIPPAEALAGDVLLPSLFRSAKPTYFGNLTWPPFNPEAPGDLQFLNGPLSRIPAGYRYINGGADPPSGTPDSTAPTPNPMSFSVAPTAVDSVSVTMTATTATDSENPSITYFFDETTGAAGGTDSGWQSSPTYVDSGLSPSTLYTYRVKARDGALNETAYSSTANVTTPASPGGAPVNIEILNVTNLWIGSLTPPPVIPESERQSFFLRHEFFGAGAYTNPAAAANFTNGLANMFAFGPPVDSGMLSFFASRPSAGFELHMAATTKLGETEAFINANATAANALFASQGRNNSLWTMMPEWDQSGGLWVAPGRPSYVGLTRQQAYTTFTDYYLALVPLGTYLAIAPGNRSGRYGAINDFSPSTFIAFQLGVDFGSLERVLNSLGDTSTGLAWMRGAARLYRKPWGMDMSLFNSLANSVTSYDSSGVQIGGWTTSYLKRHLYTMYMGGAHIIQIEPVSWYLPSTTTYNPLGTMVDGFGDFALTRHPFNTIGTAVVPVAMVIDFYSGFDPKHGPNDQASFVWYRDIPYSSGDHMLNNFLKVAYPNHWLHGTTPGAPFANPTEYQAFLAGGGDARPYEPMPTTRWGDTMDVTLNTANASALSRYRVVAVMGGVVIDNNLRTALQAFATAGGTVVVNANQVTSADESLLGVTLGGSAVSGGNSTWLEDSTAYTEAAYTYKPVTLTTATALATTTGSAPLVTSNVVGSGRVILTTPQYLQSTAETDLLLIGVRLFDELYADVLPATVSSPAVQYMFNQGSGKLIVTIINSSGSTWGGTIAAPIAGTVTAVRDYISDTDVAYTHNAGVVTITGSVPAYDVKVYAIHHST